MQHVPLSEYTTNLERMIQIIHSHQPKTHIVLITPPPVEETQLRAMNEKKGKLIIEDRSNERTYQYVLACKNLGKKVRGYRCI